MSNSDDEHLNPSEKGGDASDRTEAPLLSPHTLESIRYSARELVESPRGENWIFASIKGQDIAYYFSYGESQGLETPPKCAISLFTHNGEDEDPLALIAEFAVDEGGFRFKMDDMGARTLHEAAAAAADSPELNTIVALLDQAAASEDPETEEGARLAALLKPAIYAVSHTSYDILPQTELDDGTDISVIRRPIKGGTPLVQVVHRTEGKVELFSFDPDGILEVTETELLGDDIEEMVIEQYAFSESSMPEGVDTNKGFGDQNRAEEVIALLWQVSDELGEE
jgi:hypothetical protein